MWNAEIFFSIRTKKEFISISTDESPKLFDNYPKGDYYSLGEVSSDFLINNASDGLTRFLDKYSIFKKDEDFNTFRCDLQSFCEEYSKEDPDKIKLSSNPIINSPVNVALSITKAFAPETFTQKGKSNKTLPNNLIDLPKVKKYLDASKNLNYYQINKLKPTLENDIKKHYSTTYKYTVDSIIDLMKIELQTLIIHGIAPLKCKCCNNFFFIYKRKDKREYCGKCVNHQRISRSQMDEANREHVRIRNLVSVNLKRGKLSLKEANDFLKMYGEEPIKTRHTKKKP